MLNPTPITRERIAATEAVIRPFVRRTPLVKTDRADFGLPPGPLTFKLEMLQHSGSFKARGAFANLLLRKAPAAGVVAASGGNHGVAVAHAAHRLGVPATIFVPDVASPAKQERIRGYGAKLVIAGALYADALAASEAHIERTGAMPIHAYDQAETLLGQGSVGMELEQDAPEIDTLLVAVGGGGLIGGIAAWYGRRITHRGGRARSAPTLHTALAAGRPVDAPAGGIAADSLAPKRVGELMFPIARDNVGRRRAGHGRRDPPGAGSAVVELARGDRARRRCGFRRDSFGPLQAFGRRARGGAAVRGEYDGGEV